MSEVPKKNLYGGEFGKCQNCKKRQATVNWIESGSMVEWAHGGGEEWCEYCAVEFQLKNAKERAKAIPKLEKKLKELE